MPLRRGIAVVVGQPIPFTELKSLSHEVMLGRLTEALRKVWQEAERRRLACPLEPPHAEQTPCHCVASGFHAGQR
jgi:hypothetical protein